MSRLTSDPIDLGEVLGSLGDPGAGAVALFLGTVRDNSEAGSVERLVYEAYEPMAEKVMEVAEREVRRRWPQTRAIRMVHRLGELRVGEVSMAVAVSSPHRREAFAACRQAVEAIKKSAPIWKKEKLAGGKEAWVEGARITAPSRARRPTRGRTAR